MSYPLGAWRSPGGIRTRTIWEVARKKALDAIEPAVAQQSRSVFGLEPPQPRPSGGGLDARAQALRGIDIAGRGAQALSPAIAGQRAQFGAGIAQARRLPFNLGRPRDLSGFGPLDPAVASAFAAEGDRLRIRAAELLRCVPP